MSRNTITQGSVFKKKVLVITFNNTGIQETYVLLHNRTTLRGQLNSPKDSTKHQLEYCKIWQEYY